MIPFNEPYFGPTDLSYLQQAIDSGHTSGNGPFTKRAEEVLTEMHAGSTSLLTTSCTHSLELAARLIGLNPGDEVIVPSFTFVSTASAFMWNGAQPVFADVRPDTLNLDPRSVEERITDRTRAICLVHYAGVGAEPDTFSEIAERHGLVLIEDNAHGLGSRYGGKTLGTFGHLSTLSFHETKNITCGEGGALILNDPSLVDRAEILRDKGTDRSRFLKGQVDKYTWVDGGSSWVMSDLLAAILLGQLERFDQVFSTRMELWIRYREELACWALSYGVQLPVIPTEAEHSAHLFFLRLPTAACRDRFIAHMRDHGVSTPFHYQALSTSPQGRRIGGNRSACPQSESASETLVRLPLFLNMNAYQQSAVVDAVRKFAC